MKRLALLAFLVSCTTKYIVVPAAPFRQPNHLAAVGIRVLCGEVRASASGVAVGPNQVITAGHVVHACDGKQPAIFLVQAMRGLPTEFHPVSVGADYDVALLESDRPGAVFPVWAHVGHAEGEGKFACMVTGQWVVKCGATWIMEGGIELAVRGVPGNSGSPVFDSEGAVIGIAAKSTKNTPEVEELVLVAPVDEVWP